MPVRPAIDTGRAMSTVKLELAQGVELAHALVASAAQQLDVSVVFIKGPVANHYGLRRPTISTDVDVLVAPRSASALIAALSAAGWTRRPESRAHATFVTHSQTLIHREWPCDIDVHVEYPGFGRSPSEVFAALLSSSVSVPIAGRSLPGASEMDSVLIAALHSLRAPYLERSATEYADLVERVVNRPDAQQFIEEIAERSSELGASGPLEPFLRDIDAPRRDSERTALEPLWVLRSADLSRTAEWLHYLLASPRRRWPMILWQALVPTREDLLIDHPFVMEKTLLHLRLRRIGKGLRALPQSLRALALARRLEQAPTMRKEGSLRSSEVVADRAKESCSPVVPPMEGSVVETTRRTSSKHSTLVGSSTITRSDSVAFAEHPNGVTLLSLASGSSRPLVLTGTSFFFWKLLADRQSVDSLIDAAASEFDVHRQDIEDDVLQFLTALEVDGIIEVSR